LSAIYAGNAIQTLKSKDAKKVITVRTSTSLLLVKEAVLRLSRRSSR